MFAGKQKRLHFIDGFRGIAASMVVLTHSFTSNIIDLINRYHIPYLADYFKNFMQSGVVLFFVLSAVVLFRPYFRFGREFKAGEYFNRRFFRIYPTYLCAVILGSFAIWFNNNYPTWYNILGAKARFTWGETFKHLFIINLNGKFYNLAWWSLGIEILFYITFPFILQLWPRRPNLKTKNMLTVVGVMMAVVLVLQFFAARYFPETYAIDLYVTTIFRALEFPVCFLAGIYLAAGDFEVKQCRIFIYIGLVLVGVGVMLTRTSFIFTSITNAGYGLFYAGLIGAAFHANALRTFLSRPFMVWLGERSFSLFLVHYSVFYLVNNLVSRITTERNLTYFLLTRGIGLLASVFVAMLLFTLVERRYARGLMTANMFWPWQAKYLNDTDQTRRE